MQWFMDRVYLSVFQDQYIIMDAFEFKNSNFGINILINICFYSKNTISEILGQPFVM